MTDRPKARRIRRKKDVSPAAPKPHGLPSTLSRIRLSLSFRIAAHFSFQLVRTFLPALLILTLAFAGGTRRCPPTAPLPSPCWMTRK